MPQVVRIGDANSAGGVATVGVSSVLVNGRPISVNGNPVTPHEPKHLRQETAVGSGTVTANGIPVQYIGCTDTCGHSRVEGSPDVEVGA